MQSDIELRQTAYSVPRRSATSAVTIVNVTTPVPAELSRFVSSVLVHCPDIRAVWWSGDAHTAADPLPRLHRLVILADTPTLNVLRNSERLHRADVQALVVFDGDQFQDAWGPERAAGSLARWAWRQDEPDVAYYSEAKWAHGNRAAGIVARIRRKAFLVWRSARADGGQAVGCAGHLARPAL